MLTEHPGPRKYLLGALESTPEVLSFLLHGLSDEEADCRPDADRFTLREVVAHLADWDAIFLERMRRARDEHEPFLPDIDEGQLAIEHDYARSSFAEQLRLFTERRASLAEFARALEPRHWPRLCEHERIGRVSLEALAALIPLHDAYHLKQAVQWREDYVRQES